MFLYGVLTESGLNFQLFFALHLGCVFETKSDTFSGQQEGIWIRTLPEDTFRHFWGRLVTYVLYGVSLFRLIFRTLLKENREVAGFGHFPQTL